MAAGFKYTPPGGSLTTVTLLVPIVDRAPVQNQNTWARESLDLTVREVWTVGSGVHEISATLRWVDDPEAVLTMLAHGRNGVTLTYYPDLAVPGTNYPCLLIADGPIGLAPDSKVGDFRATVVLRRTSGGTWWGIL
jgi:hypothetical protein